MTTELTSGAFPVGFNVGEDSPTGLAWNNGSLYMVGKTTCKLHKLNPSNGKADPVCKTTSPGFAVNALNPADLTSHNGKLYMVDNQTDSLYRLNAETGEAIRLITTGELNIPHGHPEGIASHNDKLYVVVQDRPPSSLITTTHTCTLHALEIEDQNDSPKVRNDVSIPMPGVPHPSGLFSVPSVPGTNPVDKVLCVGYAGTLHYVKIDTGETIKLTEPTGEGIRLDWLNDTCYMIGQASGAYLHKERRSGL